MVPLQIALSVLCLLVAVLARRADRPRPHGPDNLT